MIRSSVLLMFVNVVNNSRFSKSQVLCRINCPTTKLAHAFNKLFFSFVAGTGWAGTIATDFATIIVIPVQLTIAAQTDGATADSHL